MERSEPYFYSNFPDDLHCLQAALKMTLDTVGKPISWEEADSAVGFVPDLYSCASTVRPSPDLITSIAAAIQDSDKGYVFARLGQVSRSRPGLVISHKIRPASGFRRRTSRQP